MRSDIVPGALFPGLRAERSRDEAPQALGIAELVANSPDHIPPRREPANPGSECIVAQRI
jgi:hypothetical protein